MTTSIDAARVAFFRDHLPVQVAAPHVTVEALSLDQWAALHQLRPMPLIDHLTGWTAIEIGDVVDDEIVDWASAQGLVQAAGSWFTEGGAQEVDIVELYAAEHGGLASLEHEVLIRFCPEAMAAATIDMPMSPSWQDDDSLWIDPGVDVVAANDDGSRDTAPIRFADNYLQLVAYVLLCEVALPADPGRQLEMHGELTMSAPAQLHELGPALMAEVEVGMMDTWFQGLSS